MNARHRPVLRQRQTGAAVLELALVTPIFVLLLYGLVTIGSVFHTQMMLSRAAADGAHLLSTASGLSDAAPVPEEIRSTIQIETIRSLALSIIAPLTVGGSYEARRTWLEQNGTLTVDNGSCGGGAQAAGQLRVSVQYPFSAVRILPAIQLPLVGSMDGWMPTYLSGCATAQL